MLQVRNITQVFGIQVFTDDGNYYGDVEEMILEANRVQAWRIRATKGSHLGRVLGGARGATVPHQLVRSIGDVLIISKTAVPTVDEEV